MKTSELDYLLPPERIAQVGARPRDSSRLLVYERASGKSTEVVFRDIAKFLRRGDLLIFNNTKVFRARIFGKGPSGGKVEIFVLRAEANGWRVLGQPTKRLRVGAEIFLPGAVVGRVVARPLNEPIVVQFFKKKILSEPEVLAWLNKYGAIPVPPYVHAVPKKFSDYQTVYARHSGSVAAPTAGFHFTTALLNKLRAQGIKIAPVTLHVGMGTFQPIKTDTVEAHVMHGEWAEISKVTAAAIQVAKKNKQRVILVGTTSTRAVESWAASGGLLRPPQVWSREVKLFINPGFKFQVADALLTNFHLPKSTLLLLVSAFIDRKKGLAILKKLYASAIKNNFRFYSFGDAIFLQ